MADAHHHSISSAKRFGGIPEDYIDIHRWFDCTKQHFCDNRHRALRHHSLGIGWCIEEFGDETGCLIRKSDNIKVPVRWIGEQHNFEDFGFIPTVQDWLEMIPQDPKAWFNKGARKLSQELEQEDGIHVS